MDITCGTRVDVHHHFMSNVYLDAVGVERVGAQGSAGRADPWTAEQSLAFMDEADIAAALLSVSSPGVEMPTASATIDLARLCNDCQAGIVSNNPKRFGSLAILPLPHIEACLHEIAHSLDDLSADGIVVMSNYAGVYLGDPRFWPVMEELDRRKAVVLVHPNAPRGFVGFPGVSLSTLEFPFDTARSIVSMLYHGTAARFPNIRFIWSHAGGVMPYLLGRTGVLSERNAAFEQRGPESLADAMRRFYYDVTQSTHPATLRSLCAVTGVDHILFGSDCPFAKERQVGIAIGDLARSDLGATAIQAIERDNSLSLFPRMRSLLLC
jgi:predicted TIM-barrel fold metal-dependent hydrolase